MVNTPRLLIKHSEESRTGTGIEPSRTAHVKERTTLSIAEILTPRQQLAVLGGGWTP